MDDTSMGDICRVCRCEGTAEKPLFHPCICTGSIKFIHQDCLVQWLKYSEKEYCELCNYRFSFIPIYSPDMPTSLPLRDVVHGLLTSLATASRFWLQLTLVAIAWLGIVPLTAFRIYKCLFSGSASAIFSLPLDLLSPDHLVSDAFYGCCVVTCTLCSFISLVWLREQILRAGPDWLLVQPQPVVPPGDAAAAAAAAAPAEPAPQDLNDPDAAAPDQLLDHEQDQAHPDHWPDDGLAPGPAVDADPGQLAAAAVGPNDPVDNNNAEADINAPAAAAAAPAAAAGGAGGPWDRAADELTWERILGLDGSLVFLEHVLWVICLNTLFILIFAFLPFHIGNQIVSRVQCLKDAATASQFVGLVTTVFGYFVIGLFLVVMHGVTCLFHLRRSQQILGLCYVTVKVSLLSVFELGVFPLVCGVWLDICSLPMLGSRLEDRQESFRSAPGTSLFIHWLVGMIYVFYFASFILLLREVVRPGVLWFLQNLNDPDFNPIQEMIHLPIIGHARRFLASLVIFGSTVLLLIWFPVLIVQRLIPGLLPFHVSIYAPPSASSSAAATNTSPAVGTSSPDGLLIADSASSQIVLSPTVAVSVSSPESSPVGELSLEFLLLQLVLPALLDHGHLRQWLKSAIRNWCVIVSSILGIRSYLLGDVVLTDAPHAEVIVRREDQENEELAILEDEEEDEVEEEEEEDSQNQPYLVPSLFPFRILCLLVFVAASVLLSGVLLMSVPVMTGRKLIALWMGDGVRVHELNTAACGLYVGLLVMRLLQLLAAWIPRGLEAILSKVREGLVILSKTAIAGVVLLGLIPLLIGILFDVVIIVPLRVPVNQSPIFYLWQDWAFGVLHTKVICGIAMLGPADLRLRDLLEQMYRAGLVHMDLRMILLKLALPVVTILGLALALPYVLVSSLVPILVSSSSPEQLLESQSLILRRVYPFLLFASVLIFLVTWHVRKYWRLLEHIKNDKYLVGKRLVNYDPKAGSKAKKAAAAAAAATHAAGPANPALQPQQQQQQQVLNDPPLEPPVEPPVLVD